MEQEMPNGESSHGLEESRKLDEAEYYMPKHFLSEEPIKYEQNDKRTLEDSDHESESFRKDIDDNGEYYMPEHFLSGNSTEMPSDCDQSPKRIKTEDSDQFSEDSFSIRNQYDQFLLQAKSNPGGGLVGHNLVAASEKKWPENLYTLSFASDGNRKRFKYSCNLCGDSFKDKRTCIRHARAHTWNEKPFPCSHCEKGFDKRWFLERHMKTHEKTRDFVCSICGKDFFQRRHLIDHMTRVHEEKNQNIGINENSYHGLEESKKVNENMNTLDMSKYIQKDTNKVIPVTVEQNSSITNLIPKYNLDNQIQQGFIEHLKNLKQNSATDEQNANISIKKDNVSLLEGTIKNHNGNKEAFFMPQHFLSTTDTEMPPTNIKIEENEHGFEDNMDNVDNDQFITSEHFLSQTINVPGESTKSNMDVNHVVGASAETLYTLTHTYETGRKRVKYSCNVCEKEFKDKRQCVRHIRSHTGEKPFKCHLCGVSFGSDSNLSRHIQTHSGEKPFNCHLCNKYFTQKASLDSHLLLHADPSERPFPCNQCEKAYIKRSQLERHLKTHAEVREFICTVCGKDFSEKRNLLDHARRRHSDKTQPKCEICNREFWSDYHFRMHMRAHEENSSIDAADAEVLTSLPIFSRRDEGRVDNSSVETFDKHSLFGSGLEVNEDGLLVVKKDAVPQSSDTIDANEDEKGMKNDAMSQKLNKFDVSEVSLGIKNDASPHNSDKVDAHGEEQEKDCDAMAQQSNNADAPKDGLGLKCNVASQESDLVYVPGVDAHGEDPEKDCDAMAQNFNKVDASKDGLGIKSNVASQESDLVYVSGNKLGEGNDAMPHNSDKVDAHREEPKKDSDAMDQHLNKADDPKYGLGLKSNVASQESDLVYVPGNKLELGNDAMPQKSAMVDMNKDELSTKSYTLSQNSDMVDAVPQKFNMGNDNVYGQGIKNYAFPQRPDNFFVNEDEVARRNYPIT